MDRAARTRVITLALLLVIAVPLILIAASRGGDAEEEPAAGLRVEPAQGAPEIVVFVEDPKLNVPATTGGKREVVIQCFDGSGAVLLRTRERWPFTDTDDGLFDPHAHVFVEPAIMRKIARCRLGGTDPPLEGVKS